MRHRETTPDARAPRDPSRRQALKLGAGALAAGSVITVAPWTARAAGQASGKVSGHVHKTDGGEIEIMPVSHASFVMTTPGPVIWNDPVGGAALYDGLPRPDLVLITHQHGDHYDPETLSAVLGDAQLVVNPAVAEMLPPALREGAIVMANGDAKTVAGIPISAVPAYNLTEDRLKYHPKGRDNGYVLMIDGLKVYIAGDTEDIPEMRAMSDVDVAFVPMNLPYTMDVTQAASAVAEFAPKVVYPYHYKGQDLDAFEAALKEAAGPTQVIRGAWY